MSYKSPPKGSVIAALDIGSSKTSCFIARITDDKGGFEVLGVGHHASDGIRHGSVSDLDAAEESIRRSVHAAEDMAAPAMRGYPLRDVVLCAPGIHTRAHRIEASIEIMGQEVADQDVRRARGRAQAQIAHPGQELIHTIATGYSLDGRGGIRDPRGMTGNILGVNIHLVTGDTGALRNFAVAVERSHLDIAALCAAPYAAGLASLVEDEMDLGCTVIDMGGGVTSVAVFAGGAMIHCDALPVGGQHVTSDIARGLTTTIVAAERLKTLYGSAIATGTDENELIDVPQVGEDRHTHPNHVPRSLLIGIIQPRMEEIFELVRARLHDSGVAPYAGRRVVLTGGASQLPGLRDLGQLVLDKQVRLGRPIRVSGLPEAASGPAFAVTAGLLTYICERGHEMPASVLSQAAPATILEKAKYWFRENW